MTQAIRKICYLSGTRADFGLMKATLCAIHAEDSLSLDIIVTGTHLSVEFGNTIDEIRSADLTIASTIPVITTTMSGAEMARNIATILDGTVAVLEKIKPDAVLLLGDRGEMLAGALAAIHLNIPVVHIHGGERSGTVDEPVRHAISKLSHYHLVATANARERLIKMGEYERNVYVSGAPGLDGLKQLASISRQDLFNELQMDLNKPAALMVFHPVLQEANTAGDTAVCILKALIAHGIQVVVLKPNSDAGSHSIRSVLDSFANNPLVHVVTHFPRKVFVSWMAVADLMIGNSSAGIIEAASFGVPVINVGIRQHLRERNENTIDVGLDGQAIESAIVKALKHGPYAPANIYGDGKTADRIVNLLTSISFDDNLLYKTNAY